MQNFLEMPHTKFFEVPKFGYTWGCACIAYECAYSRPYKHIDPNMRSPRGDWETLIESIPNRNNVKVYVFEWNPPDDFGAYASGIIFVNDGKQVAASIFEIG